MQRKRQLVLLVLPVLLAFLAAPAVAQKGANKTHVNGSTVVNFGPFTPTVVLSTSMKTSTNADLELRVTAECDTSIRDVDGGFSGTDSDFGVAMVRVWVTIDGNPVAVDPDAEVPDDGKVVFCRRENSDSTFNQGFTEVQFEATRNANAFNWYARDIGQGEHLIEVYADVTAGSSSNGFGNPPPTMRGHVGRRTLIAEATLPQKEEEPAE